MCSLYLCCRLRSVCPIYESLQVLHLSIYKPNVSCSVVFLCEVYCVSCCVVFVVLNAICMFVCLNRFMIFLIVGLK